MIIGFVAINVLGATVYTLINHHTADSQSLQVEKTSDLYAKTSSFFPDGMLTKADFLEQHQLGMQVEGGQPLSDKSFTDLIDMMRSEEAHV